MSNKTCSVLLLAFGLAACGGQEPPAEPKKAEGREETKNIRNLDNLGVSSRALDTKGEAFPKKAYFLKPRIKLWGQKLAR